MGQPSTPVPIYDHLHKCIGCGSTWRTPCALSCPFQTREFGPAVVLRAAWCWLTDYQMRVGYDVGGAMAFAAADLVDGSEADRLAAQALTALARYLTERDPSSDVARGEQMRQLARSQADQIGRALYAAAARHDGTPFDPAEFGTD